MDRDIEIGYLKRALEAVVKDLRACGHPMEWSTQDKLLWLCNFGYKPEDFGFLPNTTYAKLAKLDG